MELTDATPTSMMALDGEMWRKIKGFPNYSVSNYGRVRNDNTGKIRKLRHDKSGYHVCMLSNGGRKQNKAPVEGADGAGEAVSGKSDGT